MEEIAHRQSPLDDRRSDVVGQIASDDGRSPLSEVGRQDVGMHYPQTRLTGEALKQLRYQFGVYLDCDYPFGAFEEVAGKRAPAGADLNDERCALQASRLRDAREDRRAREKVLSESPRQGCAWVSPSHPFCYGAR
jgi:hypothetical protein